MAKTDVKLTATDTYGKATTTTITDVNPAATSSQLVQMGHLFNDLTDNTYGKTDRINTINCDTEGGGSKQTATVTLATTSVTLADLKNALKGSGRFYSINDITYDGDGQLLAYVSAGSSWLGVSLPYNNGSSYELNFYSASDSIINALTAPFTVTIRADETDNYTAAEATFTVTA